MTDIPRALLDEVDALVREGFYPTRDAALVDLVRLGLEAVRDRRKGPPIPRRPPPPGVNEPHDDRPISVRPDDVNWAG